MFFADFSKGFDLVDHCALLKELRVMNEHIAIIRWIGAFLTQRPQRCRIAGSLSSPVFPLGGIPQGPVFQKPINANPRLKINQGVYFSTPKCCSTLIFDKTLH